jgi:hypothetical protein
MFIELENHLQKATKWKEVFSGLTWEQKNPTFYLYQRSNSIEYLKGLAKHGSMKCKVRIVDRTAPKCFSDMTGSRPALRKCSVRASSRSVSAKKKGT